MILECDLQIAISNHGRAKSPPYTITGPALLFSRLKEMGYIIARCAATLYYRYQYSGSSVTRAPPPPAVLTILHLYSGRDEKKEEDSEESVDAGDPHEVEEIPWRAKARQTWGR